MRRVIGLAVLIFVLVACAYNGIAEGVNATHFSATPGTWLVTVSQLVYGFSAVGALVLIRFPRPIATYCLYSWGVGTVVASAFAPVVYGGTGIGIGIVSGIFGAVVAFIMTRLWRMRPIKADARAP